MGEKQSWYLIWVGSLLKFFGNSKILFKKVYPIQEDVFDLMSFSKFIHFYFFYLLFSSFILIHFHYLSLSIFQIYSQNLLTSRDFAFFNSFDCVVFCRLSNLTHSKSQNKSKLLMHSWAHRTKWKNIWKKVLQRILRHTRLSCEKSLWKWSGQIQRFSQHFHVKPEGFRVL